MEVKNIKINKLGNQQLQTQGELQILSEEELEAVVGGRVRRFRGNSGPMVEWFKEKGGW